MRKSDSDIDIDEALLKYSTREFLEYVKAKRIYLLKESRQATWLILGVLIQAVIGIVGIQVLPLHRLTVWLVAVLAGILITLWVLVRACWEQYTFSNYDRWLKHRK